MPVKFPMKIHGSDWDGLVILDGSFVGFGFGMAVMAVFVESS